MMYDVWYVMYDVALNLVDEAEGFDNYLLNTPVNEIYAWKLLKLKREILIQLNNKDNFAGTFYDIVHVCLCFLIS